MDRNLCAVRRDSSGSWSLYARRAWIEIIGLTYDGLIASGRSPQGERG